MHNISIRYGFYNPDEIDIPMVGDETIDKLKGLEDELDHSTYALETFLDATQALEECANGKPLTREHAQQLSTVAKTHIGSSLGLEDYDGQYGVYYAGVALEGFTDFIKTLWAKVRDGFRKVMAFLADTMARIFNNIGRIEKAAEKMIKRANDRRSAQPPAGQEIKVIRNKYLYVNGAYDPKGPDRVAGMLMKLNEAIPTQISELVVRISAAVVANRDSKEFDSIVSDVSKLLIRAQQYARTNVSDSDNPFKRPNTKAQRTDIIAANKALYIVIPTDMDGDSIKQLNRFQKSFAMYLHVVPSMNKAPKGVETKVRSANEIISAMKAVQTAANAFKKANDVTATIRKNMAKAIQSTKNVADLESLPSDRRKEIKELMQTLSACRKLMGSNIVGTYAICASTLKAHVKQARHELKAYKD